MYKETDNLIGIKFHAKNNERDKYEIINNNTIKSLSDEIEYNNYTKNEFCRYFNNKDWKVVSHNIIHELW